MPDIITYPFTNRTYVSVSIARGIAAGSGHADLTAAHIALGILREGEKALSDENLGNEHLLLAMLRDPSTPVAQTFSRHSFAYETARIHLQFVRAGKS